MHSSSPARRFERFPVQLSVVCGTDDRRLADRVVNVSCAGACIQTPAPLPVNTEEHFYFTVPDAQIKQIRSILTVVDGRIVHDAGVLPKA